MLLPPSNDNILKRIFEKNYNNSNDYLISLKIGIITSMLCTWTKNKKRDSPQEIAKITKELLSKNMLNMLINL